MDGTADTGGGVSLLSPGSIDWGMVVHPAENIATDAVSPRIPIVFKNFTVPPSFAALALFVASLG